MVTVLFEKTKAKVLLVLILVVSLNLFNAYLDGRSPDIISESNAARTIPAEDFEFVHGSRLNDSVEYWGLVTSDLVVGVSAGNENISFPLSVFVVQKQSIGMVDVIDANGEEHVTPLSVYQFFLVSFIGFGVSNQSLIGDDGKINSEGITLVSLMNVNWNVSLSRDPGKASNGGSFSLEAKTKTDLGEIGFKFWLNYSRIIKKSVDYLVVSGDLREGTENITINKTSSSETLRTVSLKIDQFMDLENQAYRSFILFEAKAVTMLSPALKRLLSAKNGLFEAFVKNNNSGNNETMTDVHEPIIFYGPGGMAAKFGWTKTVEIDGRQSQTRALIRTIERKYMSLIWSGNTIEGFGVKLSGGFVYPRGQKIVHDPDILAQSRINPQNLTILSYLEPQIKGMIAGMAFMTLLFLIMVIYRRAKPSKNR